MVGFHQGPIVKLNTVVSGSLGEFDTENVNPMDPCLNHTVPGPYPVSIHRAVQLRPVRSFLSLDTLRALRTRR